jgi:hypothetical protein
LDVAQIVPALGDRDTEFLPEPQEVLGGQLRVLLADMGNVKLVVESISIPTEGPSKEICGGGLTNYAGYPEKPCDASSDFTKKFGFLILAFSVTVVQTL